MHAWSGQHLLAEAEVEALKFRIKHCATDMMSNSNKNYMLQSCQNTECTKEPAKNISTPHRGAVSTDTQSQNESPGPFAVVYASQNHRLSA